MVEANLSHPPYAQLMMALTGFGADLPYSYVGANRDLILAYRQSMTGCNTSQEMPIPRSHFVGMVQTEPAEKAEDEQPTEQVEDPKPAEQEENSEAESIFAAIEAKLDSDAGSGASDTDSDDDGDAFERKVKSMQGCLHEVLMAKPADKADSEEKSEAEPKTPPPTDNTNGEEEEADELEFPEV